MVSAKIWESPLFLDIAKIVGGLVILLVLVLSVLRPLVKNLIGPTAHQMQVHILPKGAAAGGPGALTGGAEDTPALANAAQQAAVTHEQQIAQVRTLVTQDPKRVAQVVKGWVATDE
jgi:flagellar M-ring protein FliF